MIYGAAALHGIALAFSSLAHERNVCSGTLTLWVLSLVHLDTALVSGLLICGGAAFQIWNWIKYP